MKLLKDLKPGEYFTLKNVEYPTESQVYVRASYDRSSRKYNCFKFGDVCSERQFRGDRLVYTDFIF